MDSVQYADAETINGLNLYAYCGNNPVMNVDPDGHAWWEWLIASVATVALVAVAAVLTVTTGGLFAAVAVGAAIGATASLATQASSGEMNLGTFFIDTVVGAVSGAFCYGASVIASSVGSYIGSALGEMVINGLQVGKVFAGLASIGGFIGGLAGGFASGIFFDKHANILLGKEDSLQERVKSNLEGSFISSIFDFVKYIW